MPFIKIGEIEDLPDGSAKVNIEYDDEARDLLMKTWGMTEWDEERAGVEIIKALRVQFDKEENNVTQKS